MINTKQYKKNMKKLRKTTTKGLDLFVKDTKKLPKI